MSHRPIILPAVVLSWLVPGFFPCRAADDILKYRADANVNRTVNGELITTLTGNVTFEYNREVTVTCRRADMWESDGRIVCSRGVTVTKASQRLRTRRMEFTKGDRVLKAGGDVRFFDSDEGISTHSSTGTYHLGSRELELHGNPSITRIDTASAETLVVRGMRMYYNDSLKYAEALDSARIDKGMLTATGQRVRYYTQQEQAVLRGNPLIYYDENRLKGDSVDLYFAGDLLRGISVWGNARGWYRESVDDDTALTEIQGDSLYMFVSDSGVLDSVSIYENVRTVYYYARSPDRRNSASGKTMTLYFDRTGGVEVVHVRGNAQSVYYLEEEEGGGSNEASGDTIVVRFEEGKAVALRLAGSVRGMYYPDNK